VKLSTADLETLRRYAVSYAVSRNSVCLCGSGLKYKRCCESRVSRGADMLDIASQAYKNGDFQGELLARRAHVTWYRIVHQKHTVPLVHAREILGNRLMEIDIAALGDSVSGLMGCYFRLGNDEALLLPWGQPGTKDEVPRP
jgi:hypothetical protein